MYQPRHYKPSFIKDAAASLNNYYSCLGTIVDIRGRRHDSSDDESSNDNNKPTILIIDDGTGQIPAVFFGALRFPDSKAVTGQGNCAYHHALDGKTGAYRLPDIGDDVAVYGYAQFYRDQVQIKCDKVKQVKDPNMQALWINQVLLSKRAKL